MRTRSRSCCSRAGEGHIAELESLAVEEGLSAHVRRHAYDRLIMLSDGIFAIAITLAALEIRMPEHAAGVDELFAALKRPLIAYLISFMIVAVFWISHRNLFARLRRVDGLITGLTLAMLCMIAVVPAAIHVVVTPSEGEDWPFRFYAGTMLLCGMINAAMWLYAAARPALMAPELTTKERWTRAFMSLSLPVVFGIMMLVPTDQIGLVAPPLVAVVIIVRRVILPRLMKARA